jgi:hypothetical protein
MADDKLRKGENYLDFSSIKIKYNSWIIIKPNLVKSPKKPTQKNGN